MQMKSEIILKIKTKLKKLLKNKEILDIVIFGSLTKGKPNPKDIDIALITSQKRIEEIPNFHISIITPEEFITSPPTLINTLLREGYSLKYNKAFSEKYNYKNRCLFKYELTTLNPSQKVKIVNYLRGKSGKEGLIEKTKSEWLANQVFISPINSVYMLEDFFVNNKIKFKKYYVLMH